MKGKGKAGNIVILVQRQVRIRYAHDPVIIHDGCW